ncbi:MAG: hypothetical protein JSV96_01825 [Candidatus Aminicenantes bacterium]|nr:MAG: hypothetical protein JSV96_01825 [Candidatus Aminicenantes bacterium]
MKKRSILNISLFLLLSIMVLSSQSFIFAQDTKPFLGTWNGAISLMGQEIEMTLKFALDENKTITGTIDVPMQGATDIPLGNIKIEGKKISFMIDAPGVPGEPTFAGELDETGKKIAGTFTQGDVEGTFSVEKE